MLLHLVCLSALRDGVQKDGSGQPEPGERRQWGFLQERRPELNIPSVQLLFNLNIPSVQLLLNIPSVQLLYPSHPSHSPPLSHPHPSRPTPSRPPTPPSPHPSLTPPPLTHQPSHPPPPPLSLTPSISFRGKTTLALQTLEVVLRMTCLPPPLPVANFLAFN
jgi:hypothetical protein